MTLSIGHGPSCTKFYLVIPGTECSRTHLFLISGNNTEFSYDLIKFYNSQSKTDLRASLNSDTLSFIVTQKTMISACSQVCHTIVHSDELLRQAVCLFSGNSCCVTLTVISSQYKMTLGNCCYILMVLCVYQ